MKRWLNILNRPYCEPRSFAKHNRTMAAIGLFIAAFLFFFQPFGFDAALELRFWVALGFGLVTYTMGLFHYVVVFKILKYKTDTPAYTFLNWIAQTLSVVVLIAIGNYLYVNLLNGWNSWSIQAFLEMTMYTAAIAIFPVVLTGFFTLKKAEETHKKLATSMPTHLRKETASQVEVRLNPSKSSEKLNLTADHIAYVEAMENYLNIYLENEGIKDKKVIRMTLKEASAQLPSNHFMQCHRSYLVNLNRVKSVDGNAQGLKLQLTNFEDSFVPVSRSFIDKFKEKFAMRVV